MTNQEYKTLQELAVRLRRESDRAKGAMDELYRRLLEDHGIKSLDEANQEIKRLDAEKKKVSRNVDSLWTKVQKQWGHKLGENGGEESFDGSIE